MNYQQHYDKLIQRGKCRTLPVEVYREAHHIIPVCVGGSNNTSNLVELTAEEHFVAHQLLHKIHPLHKGLLRACQAMCMSSATVIRNNKRYGWIRRKCATLQNKRISVNGQIFDSVTIASRTLSVIEPVIRKRCNAIEYPDWFFVDINVTKVQKFSTTIGNIRLSIDGKIFKSVKSAAHYFSIDFSTVSNRCKSIKYPTWFYLDIDVPKENVRGTNDEISVRITVDGVVYKSGKEASRIFKIDRASVNTRCLSPNFPNWNFTDNPRKIIINREKKISIDGVVYHSLKDAARDIGIATKTVRARCISEKYPSWAYVTNDTTTV